MHADAFENKVLIATPTLLIGLLSTAGYGWRQEALADNAKKIADLGKELHDRIGTFVGHLGKAAKNQSRDRRVQQVGVLFGQSLVVTPRKLSELGAPKASTASIVSVAPSLPSARTED